LLFNRTIKPELAIIATGSSSLEKFLVKTLNLKRFSSKIRVVYVRPELSEHVGVRVGKAINHALSRVDLRRYDFLLKIDVDTALPLDYVERFLKLEAVLVGLGPFMLVRMKPFLRLLNGRWPEVPADDA